MISTKRIIVVHKKGVNFWNQQKIAKLIIKRICPKISQVRIMNINQCEACYNLWLWLLSHKKLMLSKDTHEQTHES